MDKKNRKVVSKIASWIDKYHLVLIAVFVVVMSVWFAYDVGKMVSKVSFVSLGTPSGDAITVESLLDKPSSFTSGGRVIVISEKSARFIDSSGKSWAIPNFGGTITKDGLSGLKDSGIQLDGNIDIGITPANITPKDLLIASLTDMLLKVTLIGFYIFLVYFIIKLFTGRGNARYTKIEKSDKKKATTFADVAGYDGVKAEIMEVSDYLSDIEKYQKVGAMPCKGVMLHGPPGTGKTMLAKAVAGESGAMFYEQSGSSFVRLFVGSGASSVRALFKEARKNSPSIIFIDEIDSLGASRGASGGHKEYDQALNQLLAEMDGFNENDGVVVIAATNRLEAIDTALLRPGRFDRKIFVGLPNKSDRKKILETHSRKIPEIEADLSMWALQTAGFSGAALSAFVNEAAVEAARKSVAKVTNDDFSKARDRILIGVQNSGMAMSEKEKSVVAYHETGHAFMRLHLGGDVEKISIAPRGLSLGVTVSKNKEEAFLQTRRDVYDELLVLMGGRASEFVVFGEITTGAYDDIKKASELARAFIVRTGGGEGGTPYLPSGESVKAEDALNNAAESLVKNAYDTSVKILKENKDVLDKVAPILLREGEIDGDTLRENMKGPVA